MHGNSTLPGFESMGKFRLGNSIFAGSADNTSVTIVNVKNLTAADAEIPLGTVLKLDMADGTYVPAAMSDLPANVAGLPGVPLTVLADKTLKIPASGVNSAAVARAGRIDIDQVILGAAKWRDLSAAARIQLETALRAWLILPEIVTQYGDTRP